LIDAKLSNALWMNLLYNVPCVGLVSKDSLDRHVALLALRRLAKILPEPTGSIRASRKGL